MSDSRHDKRLGGGLSLLLSTSLALAACAGQDPGGRAAGEAPAAAPAPAPLARLTNAQYASTVADLFAPAAVPAPALPAETSVDGFTNDTQTQAPTPALIEAYASNAHAVAAAVAPGLAKLQGCTATGADAEVTCAEQLLGQLATRAYRRPLAPADTAPLFALFEAQRAGHDLETALAQTVEAILQSPWFLYRVELGAPGARPDAEDRIALSGDEIASRLSYFLWNTMPDEELTAAAKSGALATDRGLGWQARRLLADPRAHTALQGFFAQWLRFDAMESLQKDSMAFPEFSDAVNASMIDSANRFVEHAFFEEGTLAAFFTDSHVYADDALAGIYGVPSPGAMTRVAADATQRSGILTQAGLLAAGAHEYEDSPILRGVFVLRHLMCTPPPPPPADVDTTPPSAKAGDPKTTRELFAQTHEQGVCAGCHHTIDGVGFGFEHYDAVGAWRTADSGYKVDATGWLPGAGDLTGTFDGAVDLGKKLAKSRTVSACVTSSWLSYALGVNTSQLADDDVQPLVDAFTEKGLDMRELVVSIVTSKLFRTRLVTSKGGRS